MAAIVTQDLHKKYHQFMGKEIHALRGVSLTVEEGQIFGVLGPNGAGKTTLIRILLSIIKPSSGTATLFGEKHSRTAVKKRLSYLAENHQYPRYLTGFQVLEYFGLLSGISGKKLRQRIDECLEILGMTQWRDVKIKKYSKGMMQRIGLAQTLVNDSDLMFLDEPTDGVDALGRKEIRDLLVKLRKEGKTIVLNSHLLSEVEQVCDRIVIMNHGQILREGTINDLVSQGNVYKIKTTPLQESTIEKLKSLAKEVTVAEELRVSLETEDTLNEVIDLLRAHQVSIRYIIPDRQSLEDYFIDTISQTGGAQ